MSGEKRLWRRGLSQSHYMFHQFFCVLSAEHQITHVSLTWKNPVLGGGFKCFSFSPLLGEDSQFDYYFSNGVKPLASVFRRGFKRGSRLYTMFFVGRIRWWIVPSGETCSKQCTCRALSNLARIIATCSRRLVTPKFGGLIMGSPWTCC